MTLLKTIRSRLNRLLRKPDARSGPDESPPSTGTVLFVPPRTDVHAVPDEPLPSTGTVLPVPPAEVGQRSTVEALLADLSHSDGYVREAALKRAAELRAPHCCRPSSSA